MKNHEKILQMLETVDPSDHKTLNEIDLRFALWLAGRDFGGWNTEEKTVAHSWALDFFGNRIPNSCVNHSSFPRYTRSIDAQNAVKLEKKYA